MTLSRTDFRAAAGLPRDARAWRGQFEPEVAEGVLDWPHSGFSVHHVAWLDQNDAAAHTRLARYCARCPVSLDRAIWLRG